ncbi:phage baseplate assembly protein V [Pelotomaculum propionicicum]|uniref:Gp5/Type VI secretion system Vgr protein OB-fold domain-containing protein n=1 Tax=Pelotomaculum propionicicum TaxID=258475 RepID=A0A4Y7RWH3_9FIRM|nr:phage baseplate assembly protein V [Pelotomaculum propionicicum]TEB13358.1 hypothetical protein Pmgp_00252 [Pelotomaculum propionicicum]
MDPLLKNLIRVGIISSTSPENCTARVAFEDRAAMVSFDLPVLVRGSLQNKDYWMPEPGEQVVCLFLPSGVAQGFILGSVYSSKDNPPVTDGNKRHIKFADGTTIEYDRTTHTLAIDAKGPIKLITTGPVEIDAAQDVIINATGAAAVTADIATITADKTITISAPKGISISATDPTGTGVQITGKSASGSW